MSRSRLLELWDNNLRLEVLNSSAEVARLAAQEFLATASSKAVFGFATGKTPLNIYKELFKSGPLECAAAFSLDEYLGLRADDPRSFAWYIRNRVEPALRLPRGFIHVPAGDTLDADAESTRFENLIEANPIGLQLLGTGRNGHIAFNEPGSQPDSKTRVVDLDEITRTDNGADFGGLAPPKAITQGVRTILQSKKILLVATGAAKREALARLLSGHVDASWPITYLLGHPDLVVLADQAAMG